MAPLPSTAFETGVWQNFGLLQVASPLAYYDPAHDQLLSVGGSRYDNWTLSLTGMPAWSYLSGHTYYIDSRSAAVDPSTRLVYFLANDGSGLQMHTLDPRSGAVGVLSAAGGPFELDSYSLVFDPSTERVLIAGTSFSDPYGSPAQVWAFDLLPSLMWTRLSPSGTASPAFDEMRAVLDPVRHRVLFPDRVSGSPQQITSLNLDDPPSWSTSTTNGLPSHEVNAWVYDAAGDRVWTLDSTGAACWLSMTTLQWSTAAAGGTGPSARIVPGIAIDAARHRLMVSGGETDNGSDLFNDTWALSLDGPPTWSNLVAPVVRPPVRGGASDGLDAARDRMIVFGGANSIGVPINDTWALGLGSEPTWSPISTQGTPPTGRFWHAGAWDETHDRYVVFGGYDQANAMGDLWTLSFAGGTPTWTPIFPTGTPPPSRFLAQLVRDPVRDRFLLLFGYDGTNVLNDVWELKLDPSPAWRQMTPAGIPPARSGSMCLYDPVHDRVLIFGGSDNTALRNDLIGLTLGSGDGSWINLGGANRPSPRNSGLLRFDTLRNRLLLFGGYGVMLQSGNVTEIGPLGDTWALPFSISGPLTWRQVFPTGPMPSGRDRANGAYDANFDRLIVACGGIDGANDSWGLNFSGIPTATLLSLATRDVRADRVRLMWAGAQPGALAHAYRRAPGAAWQSLADLNADGEGFVTLEDRALTPGATLEYRIGIPAVGGENYSAITQVQVPRLAFSLAARRTDGRVAFSIQLPSGEPARLELFDLSGRRVWMREVGSLGAGSHEIVAEGAKIQPAFYFARLTQGNQMRRARLALLR